MKRIKWDKIWMELAINISERSVDPKYKVGAVVVTTNNESVLAIGYNGDEKGGENKRDSMESGKSGLVHAEANALIKMNYTDPREKKLYVTLTPCTICARMIVNSGIKKVVYLNDYHADKKGFEILEKSGIVVKKYES